MRWRSKTDKSAILYNGRVTIAEIPDQAHDYLLGSRTALEWLIDRYRVKTDKASGIVNDPNIWCDEHDDPTYIVDLIKKVTTVSVETVALVGQLCDPTSPQVMPIPKASTRLAYTGRGPLAASRR